MLDISAERRIGTDNVLTRRDPQPRFDRSSCHRLLLKRPGDSVQYRSLIIIVLALSAVPAGFTHHGIRVPIAVSV